MSIVRDFEKAFNRQDVDALLACFTADGSYVDTFFGAHTGQAALRGMFERMFHEGRDYAWVMDAVVETPAAAAAEWTFGYVVSDAVPRSAGRRVRFRGMSLFELQGGTIHTDLLLLLRPRHEARESRLELTRIGRAHLEDLLVVRRQLGRGVGHETTFAVVFHEVTDDHFEELAQHVPYRPVPLQTAAHRQTSQMSVAFKHSTEQFILAAEGIVETLAIDAELIYQILDAGGVIATRPEHLHGLIERGMAVELFGPTHAAIEHDLERAVKYAPPPTLR